MVLANFRSVFLEKRVLEVTTSKIPRRLVFGLEGFILGSKCREIIQLYELMRNSIPTVRSFFHLKAHISNFILLYSPIEVRMIAKVET